jgi:ABC-type uncharacterized transport system substrate-binding protein
VATRKVGFLHNRTKASFQLHYAAFVSRLHDSVEENDVIIIEKWAGDHLKKTLEEHAEDLVKQGVDVMVAAGGPQTALAAKKATKKIPIVFTPVTDPVGLKLVDSLDRHKGNLTGIAGMTSELDVARLQLLRELLGGDKSATIGVLTNKNRPRVKEHLQTLGAAASEIDVNLEPMIVENFAEIATAFKSFKGEEPDAFLVTADSLFNDLRKKVVALPKKKPAIYQWREFAEAGGLMSFGPNIIEAYEKVGKYVGHILNGDKPGDLPVLLPDRFELVINLKVALANRIAIPASLLSRAEFVHSRLRV